MARLCQKIKKKVLILWNKHQTLSCCDLTDFFHHFYMITKKILRWIICQTDVVKFFKFYFLNNTKTLLAFFAQSGHFWTWKMQNLKSRYQNSNFQVSNSKKWNDEIKSLILPTLLLEFVETYSVKLSTVPCPWCMLFHPVKVPLKVFSILLEVCSAHCELITSLCFQKLMYLC